MDLSVIIVNFRVKLFLEQCLCSLMKAVQGIEAEIFVVDNSPEENTKAYLETRFPKVIFIMNQDNTGFARANNLALEKASGKSILFLNPDTIIPENIFEKTIPWLYSKPAHGALGIKMINGGGHYLPESKRGFPTPIASFTKMTGLSGFFPHSTFFARYYLGHLDKDENHEVDVLSGAFMLIKKEVLDKTGGFDERFFMYAEDIDLSYRIRKAGYNNLYFSETPIIHFKGESSYRDRVYYTRFYKAMRQFVEKHTGNRFHSGILGLLIRFWGAMAVIRPSGGPDPQMPAFAKTEFKGDGLAISEAQRILKDYSRHANPGDPGNNIVLCEGKSFSFRDIIAFMEKHNRKIFLVHGEGTRSVVGSADSRMQGISIGTRY